MKAHQHEIAQLLRREGLVLRREHPELADALKWQVHRRQLRPLMPGVYVPVDADVTTCIRAAGRWVPDGVIIGAAAARLTFSPTMPVTTITIAAGHVRTARAGVQVVHRRLPPELTMSIAGVRCAAPAVTALDLVAATGSGQHIDDVLRTGAATLAELTSALEMLPHRRGNGRRALMLRDSRDSPWSEAERELHRVLRGAQITGWTSNFP